MMCADVQTLNSNSPIRIFVQSTKSAAGHRHSVGAIYRGMSFELTPSRETRIMNYTIKSGLSATLLVAAMLLPVASAIAQETMMGGGTTGNGHWYGYGGGAWLPMLAIVVVGAVLFAVLRRRQ
jgi:hypothetical protein